MIPRIVGIDSLATVTEALLAKAAAAMGQSASFYGRYHDPVPADRPGEYTPAEGVILAAHGIRELPIARQTNHVSGTRSLGFADGTENARDIVLKFGSDYLLEQGGIFKMFLDVEGDGLSHLSSEYYLGWIDGLREGAGAITIQPCVYGLPGDNRTWEALDKALQSGATCAGVWLTHPYVLDYVRHHEPIQWAPAMLKPYALSVPILAWQYGFWGDFDSSMVNPDEADASEFLKTLPLPPR